MCAPRTRQQSASHEPACTHRSHFRTSSTTISPTCTRSAPSQASLDGVHLHDDLLEDLSRSAIDAHTHALAGLQPAPPPDRSRAPVADRTGRASHRGRQHRGADVRSRDGALLGQEPAGLRRRSSGRALPGRRSSRTRRRPSARGGVVSKLRQVPRLVQAARDNIKECAGIFVKIGLETWRGTLKFIEADLPRAFSGARRPAHPRRPRRHLDRGGDTPSRRYIELSRDRSRAAREGLVQARPREVRAEAEAGGRHHAERGPLAVDRAARARRGPGGVPHRRGPPERRPIRSRRGARRRQQHPEPGRLVPAAQEQIKELVEFLQRQSIVSVPESEPIVVAPTPEFYRWAFASMWTPGPVREQAEPRVLLPHRRGPLVAAGAPGRAHAGLQLPDALEHFDPRGVSRPLPPLPAPAPGGVEGAQVAVLRADVVCRRMGALLRADDGGGRLQARRRHDQAGAARRGARPSRSVRGRPSGCTARTCRSSRACASSATRRSSRRPRRGARRSAARSTPPTSSTRRGSWRC